MSAFVLLTCHAPAQRDASGRSPVLLAAALDNIEALELLLAHGFSANSTSVQNQTPLHAACTKGSVRCVQALLEAGADVHAKVRALSFVSGNFTHFYCTRTV